mmetsp:Transcript_13620/g.29497  ORF Transcript_13620/g.29497 Transcript_13620/m.29497 type:complete len:126 (+) Transcript_13620:1174-1551(+)
MTSAPSRLCTRTVAPPSCISSFSSVPSSVASLRSLACSIKAFIKVPKLFERFALENLTEQRVWIPVLLSNTTIDTHSNSHDFLHKYYDAPQLQQQARSATDTTATIYAVVCHQASARHAYSARLG